MCLTPARQWASKTCLLPPTSSRIFFVNIDQKIETLLAVWSRVRRGGAWTFLAALLRSRYFLISLTFYTLLLLVVSGIIISTYEPIRGSFDGVDQLLVIPPKATPPPPPQQYVASAESKQVKVASAASAKSAAHVLTVQNSASPIAYMRSGYDPQVAPSVQMSDFKVETDLSAKISAANVARLQNVKKFQSAWGVTGERRQTKAKFTVFQAKYQDGDWNCNPTALFNLLLQIQRWSKGRLDAELFPKVLDLGTEELFTIKPPFVYLTGHKDFHLLDQEVVNIRDYLMLGGAVWADSALVGRRSRFDMAFRREIKRVFPDRDFEDVPMNHELFDEFFEKLTLPGGMNFYQEPIEMINIGKELAVLYTLNGYGHFWEARLKETDGSKIEWNMVIVDTNLTVKIRSRNKNLYGPRWAHVYGPHAKDTIVCRNYNDRTVTDAYKFGINVVVHLLTRYQKYFKFLPMELPSSTYHGRSDELRPSRVAAQTTNEAPAEVPKSSGLRGIKDTLFK